MNREASAPYLSIVVTSRNDGHGGSPLSRTQTFLDNLSEQCRRHSLAAELIFVEWNPPADRPRLCHALREPAQPSPLDVRFIEVPAETHNELANHDKFGLFQMIAKNVGIRRSRGEFVLATNIDILFSEELIAFIVRRELREDSFYVAQRHDLGVYDIPDGLRGEELTDFARKNLVRIHYQLQSLPADEPPLEDRDGYLNTSACGDFTLMSRDAWERFGGYAEMQLYSMHLDSHALFSARASGLKQCALKPPLNIFHIEHGDGWDRDDRAIVANKPILVHSCDCQPYFYWTVKNGVAPAWNDPDWGYEGVTFRECGFFGEYGSPPTPGAGDAARECYGLWLDLADWNRASAGRVRNTPDDLARLENLAARHLPEAVAAFGCDPVRLAVLAAGTGNAPVFCFGSDPAALNGMAELLPIERERFRHVDADMEGMDFPGEWDGRRIFVHLDAASLADAEMKNMTERILPRLADGSLVLFDNVWHSPQLLFEPEAVRAVFHNRILPRLDASRSARYQTAPHREGGSLIGLSGIAPIAEYINSNSIHPCLASRRKGIWFTVDHSAGKTEWPGNAGLLANLGHNLSDRGSFSYSPLHDLMRTAAEDIAPEKMSRVLDAFAAAGMNRNAVETAKAVCLVAAGSDSAALEIFDGMERLGREPLRNAPMLSVRSRLEERLAPCRDRKTGRRDGLAIFTTAKPFAGHAGAIQRTAMRSWAALSPRPEIILFGDEEGAREMADEIGALHIPSMRRDEYGAPLLKDIFMRAQDESATRMLAYVNADIILFDDFVEAAGRIANRFPAALCVGQRWDIPAPGADVFADSGWRETLRNRARTDGFFEGCFSADYFIFTPGVWPDIPPLTLGRVYCDNWLIIDAVERGVPLVDASDAVLAIHQSHDYGHMGGGRQELWHGSSAKRNKILFGRDNVRNNMAVANWLLDADGNFTESPAPRRPDPEDNKLRRYAWLMRQSRILLDEGRLDAVRGMIEELRVRTFSDRAAIDRRVAEYERALASREGK